MKVIKIILKILMLFLTAIWGIGCGILFPVIILATGDELVSAEIAHNPVIIIWLITAIIGYAAPAVLVMCRRYKTASVMSLIGFIGILVVYTRFADIYSHVENNSGPSELYLPCVFITILILIISVLENTDVIKAKLEKRVEEKNAAAPSIFGDGDKNK